MDSLLLEEPPPGKIRLKDSPSFDGTEPCVTETHQRPNGGQVLGEQTGKRIRNRTLKSVGALLWALPCPHLWSLP